MPDKDVDPTAGFPDGEAEIKTPWELIDPDEPANPAPTPKRNKASKKTRRRAKENAAANDIPSIPSVSMAANAAATDAGGFSLPAPEDPEESLTMLAFLPDEFAAPADLDDADESPFMSNEQTSDDALVEIFVDQSEEMPAAQVASETRLTASTGLIDDSPASVTENLEEALAEKAFLSDENIVPPELTDNLEPAVETSSETRFASAMDITPQPTLIDEVQIPQPASDIPASTSPIAGPAEIFSESVTVIPAIVAEVEAMAPAVEVPLSVPQDIFHAEITAAAESIIAPSITIGGGSIEPIADRTVTAPADVFPTELFAEPKPAIEQNVTAAVSPMDPAAAPATSIPAPQPAEPSTIADAGEVETPRATGAADPIPETARGSLVRQPKPVLPIEIADDTELDPAPELEASAVTTGGGWTIPLMCLGIGLIACCLIIPQADLNRRLFYQKQTLQADLDSIQKQVAVNDEFLKEVIDNPTLAERLASRQMKTIRKGQRVLAVRQVNDDGDMSPFALVNVPRPPAQTPYRPVIGTIANLCNDSRSRLYLLGTAMTMAAVGLVLGFSPRKIQE